MDCGTQIKNAQASRDLALRRATRAPIPNVSGQIAQPPHVDTIEASCLGRVLRGWLLTHTRERHTRHTAVHPVPCCPAVREALSTNTSETSGDVHPGRAEERGTGSMGGRRRQEESRRGGRHDGAELTTRRVGLAGRQMAQWTGAVGRAEEGKGRGVAGYPPPPWQV